jgi:polyhydroxyalkanoate synthesis regulator phasin
MNDFLLSLSEQILIPALNAATLACIGLSVAWLRRKLQGAKQENVAKYLDGIGNLAYLTVQSLNQTIVDELKKSGGWSKDEAQALKNRAIQDVVRQVSPAAKKLIEKAGIDLSNYIANSIESAVREDKKQ